MLKQPASQEEPANTVRVIQTPAFSSEPPPTLPGTTQIPPRGAFCNGLCACCLEKVTEESFWTWKEAGREDICLLCDWLLPSASMLLKTWEGRREVAFRGLLLKPPQTSCSSIRFLKSLHRDKYFKSQMAPGTVARRIRNWDGDNHIGLSPQNGGQAGRHFPAFSPRDWLERQKRRHRVGQLAPGGQEAQKGSRVADQ